MKFKKNLLCTVFNELRISRWLIVLYAVITSIMFSVLFSIISFAEHIPDAAENQLNEKFKGYTYQAQISSLTSKNAELLAEIPAAAHTRITFLAEAYILNNASVSSDTAVLEGEGMINVCTSNSSDTSHILDGRDVEFSDNTSGEYSLWLSESGAADLNVKCGDALRVSIKDGETYSAALEGIYCDTYNDAAFMINASFAEDILKNAEKTTRQSCTAEFSSYNDCRNFILEMENIGCGVKCAAFDKIDEIYDNVRYMQMIFVIISLVLFACLGIILYAMNGMLVDVRTGYIAMLKSLGAKNGQIVKLYFAICEPVLVLGTVLGFLISKYYISYTSELMKVYLDINVTAESMSPEFKTVLIVFLGANAVLFLVFAFMYRKISKVSAAALFNRAESDG